jgi:hypothetical protein
VYQQVGKKMLFDKTAKTSPAGSGSATTAFKPGRPWDANAQL